MPLPESKLPELTTLPCGATIEVDYRMLHDYPEWQLKPLVHLKLTDEHGAFDLKRLLDENGNETNKTILKISIVKSALPVVIEFLQKILAADKAEG